MASTHSPDMDRFRMAPRTAMMTDTSPGKRDSAMNNRARNPDASRSRWAVESMARLHTKPHASRCTPRRQGGWEVGGHEVNMYVGVEGARRRAKQKQRVKWGSVRIR
jgi:hypothetical protein